MPNLVYYVTILPLTFRMGCEAQTIRDGAANYVGHVGHAKCRTFFSDVHWFLFKRALGARHFWPTLAIAQYIICYLRCSPVFLSHFINRRLSNIRRASINVSSIVNYCDAIHPSKSSPPYCDNLSAHIHRPLYFHCAAVG